MIIVELDKAGAEWVIVAHLANDPNMLNVVHSNESPHTKTGSLISNVPTDLVERENKLIGVMTDAEIIREQRLAEMPELSDEKYFLPRTMSIRQAGKKSNHGLNYNMQYKRFALENEIQERDAKDLVARYHHAYPGIKYNFHEGVRTRLSENRTLVNCFGRKRRFLDAWGAELFDAAYAFIPQSTTYDVIRRGIYFTYNDRSDDFIPLQLLSEVHDSFSYQYPCSDPASREALVRTTYKIVTDYLNPTLEYSTIQFEIASTVKIGKNMSDMIDVPMGTSYEEFYNNMMAAIDDTESR
jgi:DNA polymerase I-like protein with 3'-5' exonuclease and polymerase domains